MKPVLLLNVGTCFSATTPLWYTLSLDNRYVHTGHVKEHGYLCGLYTKDSNYVKKLVKKGERIKKMRNKSRMLTYMKKMDSKENFCFSSPFKLTIKVSKPGFLE